MSISLVLLLLWLLDTFLRFPFRSKLVTILPPALNNPKLLSRHILLLSPQLAPHLLELNHDIIMLLNFGSHFLHQVFTLVQVLLL
jgi:hypothetical protein